MSNDMWGHMFVGEHYDENDQQLELEWREQCRADRQQFEAQQLEQERQMLCEHALREYLMLGGKVENVKHLASECGVTWASIVGDGNENV